MTKDDIYVLQVRPLIKANWVELEDQEVFDAIADIEQQLVEKDTSNYLAEE